MSAGWKREAKRRKKWKGEANAGGDEWSPPRSGWREGEGVKRRRSELAGKGREYKAQQYKGLELGAYTQGEVVLEFVEHPPQDKAQPGRGVFTNTTLGPPCDTARWTNLYWRVGSAQGRTARPGWVAAAASPPAQAGSGPRRPLVLLIHTTRPGHGSPSTARSTQRRTRKASPCGSLVCPAATCSRHLVVQARQGRACRPPWRVRIARRVPARG